MQGKNSFVLYTDLIEVVEEMTDSDAGLLFKTILEYVNDKNPNPKGTVKLAFIPIKQDLKRDLEKWKGIKKVRSDAGKKHTGNQYTRAKEKTVLEQMGQNGTNGTVNDNVNVNVNDNVCINTLIAHTRENVLKICKEFNLQYVDPDKFFNYYEAYGWDKLEDWTKALIVWDTTDKLKAKAVPEYIKDYELTFESKVEDL